MNPWCLFTSQARNERVQSVTFRKIKLKIAIDWEKKKDVDTLVFIRWCDSAVGCVHILKTHS